MSDTVVAASLKLDSAAAETSMKNFKTQITEAKNELIQVTQKFGATSAEAVNAAKKVAGLKDAIGDAKGLSDAFNPDAKFKAFSNAIGGVVGGFSGLTGAMALFGGKSAEVEQTLLKVQAAMAFSQGVNSVLESKDAFIALGAKIKDIGIFQKANALANQLAAGTMKLFGVAVESSSTSFKVLKGAIAATGIGLLVVLIGEAVSAFQAFSGAAEKAEEAQKSFNEATVKGADIQLKSDLGGIKRRTDIAIAQAKLAGASEKELFDIQQQGQKERVLAQQIYFNDVKDADQNAKIAAKDALYALQNEVTLSELQFQAEEKKRAESAAKEREAQNKEEAKKTAERLKQKKEDAQKLREFLAEEAKQERERQIKEAAEFAQMDADQTAKEIKQAEDNEKTRLEAKVKLAELGVIDAPDSPEAKIEKLKAELELELSTLAEGDLQRQVLTRTSEEAITKIQNDEAEKRIVERQIEADAKLAIQNAELGNLAGFGYLLQQIAGKNKAIAAAGIIVENAAGIARIIINTISANAKAVAASPLTFGQPWVAINTISGILGVASSIAATTKALSQLGGGGNVGSVPSLASQGTGATTAPLAPKVESTRLDADSLNQIGNAANPVRAYVLDQDSANNRERNERLSRAARLA